MELHHSLTNQIYEAATVPDLWPAVLSDLCREVRATEGFLVTWRTDHWIGLSCSSESSRERLDAYARSDAPLRSITTPRLLATNAPGFLADQDLFTEEEYGSDPMMTEWARPSGLYHGAATAIRMPNGDVAVVQIMRRKGRPAFSREAIDRLNHHRPHIARAVMLAARWRMERLRAAMEALALLGFPAAVFGANGHVMMANSLIQEMKDHILWGAEDRIEFADRSAMPLLRRAVDSLDDPASATVRSFPLRGRNPGSAAVAHLVPITGRSRGLFEGGLGILVVTPVKGPNPPDLALIQSLFDLTPAEARVAHGLVKGWTIDEMAEQHGTVRETVRSQVKAVLHKTGSRRQAEAASKLSGLGSIRILK